MAVSHIARRMGSNSKPPTKIYFWKSWAAQICGSRTTSVSNLAQCCETGQSYKLVGPKSKSEVNSLKKYHWGSNFVIMQVMNWVTVVFIYCPYINSTTASKSVLSHELAPKIYDCNKREKKTYFMTPPNYMYNCSRLIIFPAIKLRVHLVRKSFWVRLL